MSELSAFNYKKMSELPAFDYKKMSESTIGHRNKKEQEAQAPCSLYL